MQGLQKLDDKQLSLGLTNFFNIFEMILMKATLNQQKVKTIDLRKLKKNRRKKLKVLVTYYLNSNVMILL